MEILAHKGSGVIAGLIKLQTWGSYSHISVRLKDGSIIEAREFNGVQHIPELRLGKKEEVDVFRVKGITTWHEEKIEQWLKKQIGKGYDYLSVIRFIYRRKATRSTLGKWFCSELVFEGFAKFGIHFLLRVEGYKVSPSLLTTSPILIYEDTIKA